MPSPLFIKIDTLSLPELATAKSKSLSKSKSPTIKSLGLVPTV